jgi:signal transduction histidine kinase
MRTRLVLGGVAVVALTLLAFALPLGLVVRAQVVASGLDGFAGGIEQTATLIDERSRTCAEVQVTLTALAREDVEVTVFDRAGEVRFVQRSALQDGEAPVATAVVEQAIEGSTGSALVDGRLFVAVPLSTPVCGERLVLQGSTSADALQQRVRRAWGVLGLAATVAVAAGAITAAAAGRRFARPLESLADAARQLGDGDFTTRAPRAGMEEADAIADALDRTADRLGRAVARGTAFAADASHQLRTPLTALRLHLESARATAAADPAAIDDALAEADRLEATIAELVELTQLDAAAREVDLGALVRQRVDPWRARATQLGRSLDVRTAPRVRCTVRPTAVAQALEVLVDNAFAHGTGQVDVRVLPATPDSAEDTIRLRVLDDGPGMPDDALTDRSDRGGLPLAGGRGLALARDLVEAEGGRLVLGSEEGRTCATIVLPRR